MTTSKQVVSITAHKINTEYRKAKSSMVDSANHIINVGQMLTAKKAELGRGNFDPWVKEYCEFERAAAYAMMKSYQSSSQLDDLTEEDAVAISRETWHNKKIRGTQGTGDNEWYTPVEYVEAVRDVLGVITLDPASNSHAQKTVRANRHFSIDDDGLKQSWQAETVFLNPPYAQPLIAEFILKLVSEYNIGNIGSAILLTHNYTDTEWFHTAEASCSLICFTRGRIKFVDSNNEACAPTQGQAFFYFGDDKEGFRSTFEEIGFVR